VSAGKSLPPSAKRLRELRKQGHVVKSRFLTQGLVFAGVGVFFKVLPYWVPDGTLLQSIGISRPEWFLGCCVVTALSASVAVLGIAALVGVMSELLQSRFLCQFGLAAFKWERLDPLSGTKRLIQGGKRFFVALTAIAITLCFSQVFFKRFLQDSAASAVLNSPNRFHQVFSGLETLYWSACVMLLVFGVVQLLWRHWRFMAENGMSFEELKREYREDEGDPYQKAERRGLHEALLLQQLEQRVRKASVILIDRGINNKPAR